MGYVYLLLQVNEHGEETFKIGITKNDVDKRLRQLQTGNANTISVLKTYESENYKKIEKWLHKLYSNKTNASNEWRNLTDTEVSSFLDTCKKADETISFMFKENYFFK